MRLATAPAKYDPADQAKARGALEQADAENHKRNRDLEVGIGCRVILTDTDTGARYALTSASGVLTLTGPL